MQGNKLKPGGKERLEDGASVCFGPADQGHIKFVFYENFHLGSNDSPAFYSAKSSPRDYVDPSGYDSVSTQDFNSCRSSPLEHNHQIEVYRSEIARLKVHIAEMELKLKQEKESKKLLSTDFQKAKRLFAENECKFNRKIDSFKAIMNKYRTLIGQLESSQSQSRCTSSDDESSNERACTESSPFGGHVAVSSALREITCTICSEYLISPTSLSCSHVFCLHCIDAWKHEYRSKYNSVSNGICPVCRKEVEHQTQPLAFENLVNILLEMVLTPHELNERRILVETRKKQPLASAGCTQSLNNSSLGSFLSQILNGVARNRRSSITIPSDSDDDQVESDDEVYSIDDVEDDDDDDDDVVEIDEEIDISITLSSSNLQEVLDGHDSDAEILMIENDDDDDDISNDSSQVVYLLEDSEDSASESISSSDSEDSRETGSSSSRRRRRRSSMIILSDSDDSLPVRRNSVTSRATIDVLASTSPTLASNSSSSRSQGSHGSRSAQSSRRAHPYHRRDRSNSGNGSNNISRRHQVCV